MKSTSLVDTHVHLDMIYDGKYCREVLDRALKHEVAALISVGIDVDSSCKAVEHARMYSQVFAAVGIHPNDAREFDEAAMEILTGLAAEPKVVAWGEIGLDYYRKHTPGSLQRRVFEAQLEAAALSGLPVIIHDRDAHGDCISILRDISRTSDIRGVFHCFSGNLDLAVKVLDLGFFISFTGVVTFPNAADLLEVVRFVPIERILVETDSPFLSPVPFRGKVNEPARVAIVAEKIAQIKGLSTEEVAHWTTRNARDLFGLPLP